MRLIRMNKRSRYSGMACMHCHKPVTEDRVAFASTYYLVPGSGWVTTYSRRQQAKKRNWAGRQFEDEVEVRIVYHRACIEKILAGGPLDREIEQSLFEEYRERLLEEYEPRFA